jgi:hypothetical protein
MKAGRPDASDGNYLATGVPSGKHVMGIDINFQWCSRALRGRGFGLLFSCRCREYDNGHSLPFFAWIVALTWSVVVEPIARRSLKHRVLVGTGAGISFGALLIAIGYYQYTHQPVLNKGEPRITVHQAVIFAPTNSQPLYSNVLLPNSGSVTAKGVIHNWSFRLTDRLLTKEEEDAESLKAFPQSAYPGPNDEEYIIPGQKFYFTAVNADINRNLYSRVLASKAIMYLFVVVKYRDVAEGQTYLTEYCALWSGRAKEHNCLGHNRAYPIN